MGWVEAAKAPEARRTRVLGGGRRSAGGGQVSLGFGRARGLRATAEGPCRLRSAQKGIVIAKLGVMFSNETGTTAGRRREAG
jgi:hypothetical protein